MVPHGKLNKEEVVDTFISKLIQAIEVGEVDNHKVFSGIHVDVASLEFDGKSQMSSC